VRIGRRWTWITRALRHSLARTGSARGMQWQAVLEHAQALAVIGGGKVMPDVVVHELLRHENRAFDLRRAAGRRRGLGHDLPAHASRARLERESPSRMRHIGPFSDQAGRTVLPAAGLR